MSSVSTAAERLAETTGKPSRLMPLLLLLFGASGCAALIYEVVWYQELQLSIGATSVSLGILLSTFMGGLCIGSIWLPKRTVSRHPLLVYAALEAGIAVCALLVHLLLPFLNRVYFAGAEHGLAGMLSRGLLAAVCMLPATILMGASLPAIVRWVEATPEGVAWWGFLYGANTLGAVLGCLIAGFYLLRVYNMGVTTAVAAAINLVVAAISFALGKGAAERAPAVIAEERASGPHSNWPVYLTIALSGATALGAEVVWTRLLGMLLLATVYVFSIILAVFLAGLIGIGVTSQTLRGAILSNIREFASLRALGVTTDTIAPKWPGPRRQRCRSAIRSPSLSIACLR